MPKVAPYGPQRLPPPAPLPSRGPYSPPNSSCEQMCCIQVVPHFGYVQTNTSVDRGTISFADLKGPLA